MHRKRMTRWIKRVRAGWLIFGMLLGSDLIGQMLSNDRGWCLSTVREVHADTFDALDTPLLRLHPSLLTAPQLRRGEVAINARGRFYESSGSVESRGITLFYDAGVSWGILDTVELTLQFQHIDSSFPRRQGVFQATTTADNEGTLAVKYRLWHNAERTLQLGTIGALSFGDRGERFRGTGRPIEKSNHDLVPTLQLPFTATFAQRWHLTLAPTLVFFPDAHALYVFRPPVTNADEFGTMFGFSGAASYRLHERFVLWGDGFVPVAGHNSMDRGSGQPTTAFPWNAGVRYFIHPRLAVDVFATNALGSTGALAFMADPDKVALGTNMVFLPDLLPANRRYPSRFTTTEDGKFFPATVGGLAFFDGGLSPNGSFRWDVQGGTQGVLSALHFTPVLDLELAMYLDYIWGKVDESEQGIGLKLRVLHQVVQHVLTASVGVTVGLTNRVFLNFFQNEDDAFDKSGLAKNIPLLPRGDRGKEGELFLVTLSLPVHYQRDSGIALWLTPTLGVIQRRGLELAGVNIGGALPLFHNRLSVLGEVGGNFAGKGNAFLGDHLADAIPWAAAVRLHFDPLQQLLCCNKPGPYLELYVTNRVGSSPFHSLRVRDGNDVAFGVGVSLPLHF